MGEDEQDNEMDDLRKKRIERQKEAAEAHKQEEKLKSILRIALEDAAYERLINVRLANQRLYLTAAQYLLQLYKQAGRRITEDELILLLRRIKENNEKDTEIKFRRK